MFSILVTRRISPNFRRFLATEQPVTTEPVTTEPVTTEPPVTSEQSVAESFSARLERRKLEWSVMTTPVPIKRLRHTPPREQWQIKLTRLGHDVSRVALTGGYLHELWWHQLSGDARALGLQHHRFNVYALEEAIIRPELARRLRALNLSTDGDYVDLRRRLAENSNVFSHAADK